MQRRHSLQERRSFLADPFLERIRRLELRDFDAVDGRSRLAAVSTETTFAEDINDQNVLRIWLFDLVDHLATRLRHEGVWARTIDVKIRSSDFHTLTRSKTLTEATNVTKVIWKAAAELFEHSLSEDLLPVRLLGVGATKLTREPVVQGNLFENESHERQIALDHAVDTIRAQYGTSSIKRGNLFAGPTTEGN